MQCARNGSAAAPAVSGRIVHLQLALAAEASDDVDFPPTSAAAISVREEGIGAPTVQRPVPCAQAVAAITPTASVAAVSPKLDIIQFLPLAEPLLKHLACAPFLLAAKRKDRPP